MVENRRQLQWLTQWLIQWLTKTCCCCAPIAGRVVGDMLQRLKKIARQTHGTYYIHLQHVKWRRLLTPRKRSSHVRAYVRTYVRAYVRTRNETSVTRSPNIFQNFSLWLSPFPGVFSPDNLLLSTVINKLLYCKTVRCVQTKTVRFFRQLAKATRSRAWYDRNM